MGGGVYGKRNYTVQVEYTGNCLRGARKVREPGASVTAGKEQSNLCFKICLALKEGLRRQTQASKDEDISLGGSSITQLPPQGY